VLRVKDLLKTSGRGTNWVLPSSAGQYYLGKNMPSSNFTNWSISNKAMLPAVGAAYSAMRECLLAKNDELFIEHFEYYLDHTEEYIVEEISMIVEDGNFAGQVANAISPMSASIQSDYKASNEKRSRKLRAALNKSCSIKSTSILP
jgi:hypothetical protein